MKLKCVLMLDEGETEGSVSVGGNVLNHEFNSVVLEGVPAGAVIQLTNGTEVAEMLAAKDSELADARALLTASESALAGEKAAHAETANKLASVQNPTSGA